MGSLWDKLLEDVLAAGGRGALIVGAAFTLVQYAIVALLAAIAWDAVIVPIGVQALNAMAWIGVLLVLGLFNAIFIVAVERVWATKARKRILQASEANNAIMEQNKKDLALVQWRTGFQHLANGSIGRIEVLEPCLDIATRQLRFVIWLHNPMPFRAEVKDIIVSGLSLTGTNLLGRDLLVDREDKYGEDQWRLVSSSNPVSLKFSAELTEKRSREVALYGETVLPFSFDQMTGKIRAMNPDGAMEELVFVYGRYRTLIKVVGLEALEEE